MKHKEPPESSPENAMPVISSMLSMKFMAASFYLTEQRLAEIESQTANNNGNENKSGAPKDA